MPTDFRSILFLNIQEILHNRIFLHSHMEIISRQRIYLMWIHEERDEAFSERLKAGGKKSTFLSHIL